MLGRAVERPREGVARRRRVAGGERDEPVTVERIDTELGGVDTGAGGGELVVELGACLREIAGCEPDETEQPVQATGGKDIVNTPGSLEDAVGNCTIVQRTAGRFTSTAALVAAHLAGDDEATRVWLTSVQHLAAGIVSIVNAIDPARVILGGGIATHAGEALLAPLREWMSAYEWRPRGTGVEIVLAALGDQAGAIGAAAYAREQSA